MRAGSGSAPTTGHQKRKAVARKRACSRAWTQRVLERQLEERAEVGRPHDDREQGPVHDRLGEHAQDARVQCRQQPALPTPGVATRSASVTGAPRQSSGRGHEDEQQVLHHVDAESVVA